MDYEWDVAKNLLNFEKHGIDFSEAVDFEWDVALVTMDNRYDYGEERFMAYAPIGSRLFAMTFTIRNSKKRLISLRKSNHRELKHYVEKIKTNSTD